MDRKTFLSRMGYTAIGGAALFSTPFGLTGCTPGTQDAEMFFDISLAQWSLNNSFFNGSLDPINFARIARQQFDIGAVEYVNRFYTDHVTDQGYLNELRNIANGEGVESVLIMCDNEGALGDPDPAARQQAAENHYKWLDMASFLGCHSIRVNAASSGSYEEQMQRAADGLRRLSEHAAGMNLGVIVENHGGLSSNAEWLVGVIEMVDMENCGTLPDFGNFRISQDETYDNYRGTEELMPYAKGVSAKSYAFDDNGNEANLDYMRLMQIVKDAGYTGYVGIEYEGDELSESDGIMATKELLMRVGKELADG
ncbi:sugar phosphate isomerase/epimerase family protein [Rhodohalobacter mucosus]|uniref:Xylose isomerase n=1 Tax=Rhodohalobacter mucosus TaxID=2079485 RepID=A0A316TPC1_9BACT|nr:sugar phosphate isomerase/epimerase family protein [Rhodohalobacter mucosus]PWN06463.1 xylose isomerase [Rhodohalobacter mucosus]